MTPLPCPASAFALASPAMVNRQIFVGDLADKFRCGAISIGNFDGVHRGHAALLAVLRSLADRVQGPAVAVTFDPAPAAILRPDVVPPQLTTIRRRIELLKQCGADHVLVCKTDRAMLNQTAEEFFANLVIEELAAKGMVEGPNFFFGRGRAGNIDLLRQLCRGRGIALEIAEPQSDDSLIISSTRVRDLLTTGHVDEANRLLTAPYRIAGDVARGASRGREIGFPTANLTNIETLVPGPGVYASRVYLHADRKIAAATHIGPNPTFDEDGIKVEVHLLEFSGDLYDKRLEVDFVSRIRGVARFGSSAELTDQLKRDLDLIRMRLRDF